MLRKNREVFWTEYVRNVSIVRQTLTATAVQNVTSVLQENRYKNLNFNRKQA